MIFSFPYVQWTEQSPSEQWAKFHPLQSIIRSTYLPNGLNPCSCSRWGSILVWTSILVLVTHVDSQALVELWYFAFLKLNIFLWKSEYVYFVDISRYFISTNPFQNRKCYNVYEVLSIIAVSYHILSSMLWRLISFLLSLWCLQFGGNLVMVK